ncbi:hypothetical protein PRK78_005636 [Emydomyces testavorans]|uniref:Uncharacterized protein n=1 Tax=Emydomyces testavorans TaxID=2070801 RepID=A0AAF0DJY5_9EURO|nr:hypothetical protein PRK78_005636 [Emydomyces testavorans]
MANAPDRKSNVYEVQSETESEPQQPNGPDAMQRAPQGVANRQQQPQQGYPYAYPSDQQLAQAGQRRGAIRESRIKDRPVKESKDSSLKIKIELDLEVEVDLYARVKGDVTIGLL